MKRSTIVLSVLALAGVMLIGAAVAGAAAGQQRATNGDPLSACSTAPDAFGGNVFRSTEPEAWLAANPAHSQNLIGSIQQDRWSDGGAQGLVAPYSLNGGKTWKEVPLPFSVCASSYYGGNVLKDPSTSRPYDRASDPWVSIGPDGTAYAVSISFDVADNAGAVGAATSRDGGKTWHHQQNITSEDPNDTSYPFNDKESVTADPVHAGVAYAVWDRLQNIECPPGVPPGSVNSDDRPFRVGAALGSAALIPSTVALNCSDGPTMFSRTDDFGHTWSTPVAIVPTPANEQTIANQIVVDPTTDTLYDFYMYIHADNSLTIEDVASHDGGVSWGPRQVVSDSQSVGVSDPRAGGKPFRTGDIIPEPAINPATGRLYVVWQDSRANSTDPHEDALFISSSALGGGTGTWSAPAVVNNRSDEAAFTPAIKVLGNGKVAVEYYVLRGKGGTGPGQAGVLTTGVVLRTSNGPAPSFTKPEKMVGADFNMLAAPWAGGWFAGDYEGLSVDVRNKRMVHTFFTATNCQNTKCDAVSGFNPDGSPIPSTVRNPTDVYSRSVNAG